MATLFTQLYPNSWVNLDGLFVRFGTDEAVVSRTGAYEDTYGPEQVQEVGFSFADLGPTFGNTIILNTTSPLRKGSRIQEVVLIAETGATSGGAPTLSVGLINDDFATVSLSNNAIVNAETLANLSTAGNQLTYNKSALGNGGTSIGTTLVLDQFFTITANTATFTAGQFLLVVRYYLPSTTE